MIQFLAVCTLIALVGGLAKGLYDRGGRFSKEMLGNALACAFAGFIVACGMLFYVPDYQLLIVAATGLIGWGGPAILNYLSDLVSRVIKRKAGGKYEDDQQPEGTIILHPDQD